MPDAVSGPPEPAPVGIAAQGKSRAFALATETDLPSEIAAQVALGEHEMRRDVATAILRAFVVGNIAVWALVTLLIIIDVVMIVAGYQQPTDRVIDQGVVKTLVGATAVQIGFIMLAIAGNLFPRTRRPRP